MYFRVTPKICDSVSVCHDSSKLKRVGEWKTAPKRSQRLAWKMKPSFTLPPNASLRRSSLKLHWSKSVSVPSTRLSWNTFVPKRFTWARFALMPMKRQSFKLALPAKVHSSERPLKVFSCPCQILPCGIGLL